MPQTLSYNSYICAPRCRRFFIFQTLNHVRPKSLSLKYQRFTPSGLKEIGIRQFEFVTKTQFLFQKCNAFLWLFWQICNDGYQLQITKPFVTWLLKEDDNYFYFILFINVQKITKCSPIFYLPSIKQILFNNA